MINVSKIKNSFNEGTIIDDIRTASLMIFGYGNKYMCGINSMYKAYLPIKRKYQKYIKTKHFNNTTTLPNEKKVYVCWFQGMENAPELVKNCYASIKYHIKDMEIVLITNDNYKKYCDFPDYIIEKWEKGQIPPAHFSDLIRINILTRLGGLWLDATTYLTGSIPKYITDSDFFVYQNGFFNNEMINMGSWLIYSKPNNILLLETQELLFKYWKKHSKLKHYFLLHMFFRMVTDEYPQEWNSVAYYNQIDQHVLQSEFNKKYNSKRFEQIKALTPIHKLTNKTNNLYFENDSFFSKLDYLYK